MNVLIVKMSSLGDIVHAQPLVSDLLAHFPDAKVDWVCERAFSAIPAMNPGVRHVIPIALRRWRRAPVDPQTRSEAQVFLGQLRSTHYDWVIDCQGLIKSALVSRLAQAGHRAGLSWSSASDAISSLAHGVRVRVDRSLPAVERNRRVASAALGYPCKGPARFNLQARRDAETALWLSGPYAVLVPGASRDAKLWPESHWIALCQDLVQAGLQLLWLWGSEKEAKRVRRLAQAVGSVTDLAQASTAGPAAARTASVIPPFLSVDQAAGVLAQARVVVGLDTGLTHLAGALGRPTLAIFCDFDPALCAVQGDGPCESLGGIAQIPPVKDVRQALGRLLDQAERHVTAN